VLRHRLWRLYKQALPLAPGMEIAYVVKDAKKWEFGPGENSL